VGPAPGSDWNDIRKSRGHVGIPLVSQAFVLDIPMVSRMLQDLGVADNLIVLPDAMALQKIFPTTGTFHVPDAGETLDQKGRKTIPQQEFVKANGFVTVFGIGGPYAAGCRDVAVAISFAEESLQRDIVERFERVMENFNVATAGLIKSNKIFTL